MNRTYIEMMLDLADRGKTVMPSMLYKECKNLCYLLHEHLEVVEEVVQTRIKIYKVFDKYDGYHKLVGYQKFIIDYVIICKLLGKGCYITMPRFSGQTIFYKTMVNMWYCDMMMKEFSITDRNEFLQKRFNMPVEKEEDKDEIHNIK